jgi:uncharacterized alkaline shock family protein YloU
LCCITSKIDNKIIDYTLTDSDGIVKFQNEVIDDINRALRKDEESAVRCVKARVLAISKLGE